MLFSAPVMRLYGPAVACWWMGVVVTLYWWGGLAPSEQAPRRHLRLISDHGKLV